MPNTPQDTPAVSASGHLIPRGDLRVFESNAAPGELAIVIERMGARVCRIEVAESMYTDELADVLIRWVESVTAPHLTLIRGDVSSPPSVA